MDLMRYYKGMVVEIEFSDHVEDGSEPMDFVVYGKIVQVEKRFLVIESWAYSDPKLIRDDNVKFWTILRSAIKNSYQLERKGKEK